MAATPISGAGFGGDAGFSGSEEGFSHPLEAAIQHPFGFQQRRQVLLLLQQLVSLHPGIDGDWLQFAFLAMALTFIVHWRSYTLNVS